MNKIIIFGISSIVLILLGIVIMLTLRAKKEKYSTTSSTTSSTPFTNMLTVDVNGNIDVSNIANQLAQLGGSGDVGQVIASTGATTAPVWTSGMKRHIAYANNLIPSTTSYAVAATIFTMQLNNLNPGKQLLITLNCPVWSKVTDIGSGLVSFSASVGQATSQLLTVPSTNWGGTYDWSYPQYGLIPTLVFNISSDTSGPSQTLNVVVGGSSPVVSWIGGSTNFTCTVEEIE